MENLRLYTLLITVTGALVIIVLERLFPYSKGQKFLREGFFNDFVWYTFMQSYVLGMAISYIIELLDSSTGLSRLHLVSAWPLWGQFLFFLVVHDFYIYWFHRFQHHSRYFWRLHEAHHSAENVDWLAGSRSHSLEILINQTVEFAPIVLLGAAPEIAVLKGMTDALWGMYIHSNINVRTGWLQHIINGPEMHRWHHATDAEAHNKNFATKLAIWDWLFGTAHFPQHKPSGFGLGDPDYPINFARDEQSVVRQFITDTKNYLRQHLYAFRKFVS